jgi:hypothetical protein
MERLFTPHEASKLLVDVKPRLTELMERKKVVDTLRIEVEKYNLIGMKTAEARDKARRLDTLAEDVMRRIRELEDLGLVVRDVDQGLVDFPAVRFGEKVFLCWRAGERDVSFWHNPDEGFSGRKSLKTQLTSP